MAQKPENIVVSRLATIKQSLGSAACPRNLLLSQTAMGWLYYTDNNLGLHHEEGPGGGNARSYATIVSFAGSPDTRPQEARAANILVGPNKQ
jgi:hypothetical protein